MILLRVTFVCLSVREMLILNIKNMHTVCPRGLIHSQYRNGQDFLTMQYRKSLSTFAKHIEEYKIPSSNFRPNFSKQKRKIFFITL